MVVKGVKMYKVKLLKECHTSIKDVGGRQRHHLCSMEETLILKEGEYREVQGSLRALAGIGVLKITDLSKEEVEEEVNLHQVEESSYKNYTQVAQELLSGEGLNHASFTRSLGLDSSIAKDKKSTKEAYVMVLEHFKSQIMRQGHDYFWEKKLIVHNF
jgi:hypothetical protein